MKKLLIVSALLLIAGGLFAEVGYISSVKAGMHAEAAGSSKKLADLDRGTQVTILAASGSWVRVRSASGEGWVQKLFVQANPPAQRVSILGNASTQARVHARTRANSDVTAASARGLLEEKGAVSETRARGVDTGSSGVLHEQLLRIENLYMSDEELLAFLKAGGIRD